MHGVTLISVDQCQYLLKDVLHKKRQGMFLLDKSIPEVCQCCPQLLGEGQEEGPNLNLAELKATKGTQGWGTCAQRCSLQL